MTIFIPIPNNLDQEKAKNQVNDIFQENKYLIEDIEIESPKYKKDIHHMYVDLKEQSLEQEAVNKLKGEKLPNIDFDLRPKIYRQEICIKNKLEGEDDIKQLCEEQGGGKIDKNGKNPVRIRKYCVYIDMENREEADKVIKNLNGKSYREQTLKVELKSVIYEIRNNVNQDKKSANHNKITESLKEFHHKRDYDKVTEIIRAFVFNACNYLSKEEK